MVKNFQVTLPVANPASAKLETKSGVARLVCAGDWTLSEIPHIDEQLSKLDLKGARNLEIDGTGITSLDSGGAWLLLRTKREADKLGAKATLNIPEKYQALFDTMESGHSAPPVTHPPHRGIVGLLERTGEGAMHALRQGYDLLGFLGRITVETIEALL